MMPLELLTPGERGEITEIHHCGGLAVDATAMAITSTKVMVISMARPPKPAQKRWGCGW